MSHRDPEGVLAKVTAPSAGAAVPRGRALSAGDILGCVLETRRGRGAEIANLLRPLGGVEVHGGAEADKLVVTIEDSPECSAIDRLGELSVIAGVTTATLVYHCDARALNEPAPCAADCGGP